MTRMKTLIATLAIMTLMAGTLMVSISPALARNTHTSAAVQAADVGSIRFVNASPDAPTLDFYFNSKKVYSGLKFKDVSTYSNIANGTYDIKAFTAPSSGTGTPLFEVPSFIINGGSASTLVAVGLVKNNSLTALPLTDNNSVTAGNTNQAKIRFIHGSPDAPAVSVQVNGVGDIFNSISFKSIGSYTSIPAGTLNLTVKPTADQTQTVLNKSLNVSAGKVYSVFVVGQINNSGLDTVLAEDKAISSMPSTGSGFGSGLGDSTFNQDGKLGLLLILGSLMVLSGLGYSVLKLKASSKSL